MPSKFFRPLLVGLSTRKLVMISPLFHAAAHPPPHHTIASHCSRLPPFPPPHLFADACMQSTHTPCLTHPPHLLAAAGMCFRGAVLEPEHSAAGTEGGRRGVRAGGVGVLRA